MQKQLICVARGSRNNQLRVAILCHVCHIPHPDFTYQAPNLEDLELKQLQERDLKEIIPILTPCPSSYGLDLSCQAGRRDRSLKSNVNYYLELKVSKCLTISMAGILIDQEESQQGWSSALEVLNCARH